MLYNILQNKYISLFTNTRISLIWEGKNVPNRNKKLLRKRYSKLTRGSKSELYNFKVSIIDISKTVQEFHTP